MLNIKMADSIIQRKNFSDISSQLSVVSGAAIQTDGCKMYSDGSLLVIKVNFRANDTIPSGVIYTGVPTTVAMTFALNGSSTAHRGLILNGTIYLEESVSAGWYNGEAVVPIIF